MKQNNESTDLDRFCLSDSMTTSRIGPAPWFVKVVFFTLKISQTLFATV